MVKVVSDQLDPQFIKRVSCSNCALGIYLIKNKYGIAKVREYLNYIENGGDYYGSPTHILPLYLHELKASDKKYHRREDLYAFLACFTLWVNGKTITKKALKQRDFFKDPSKVYDHFVLPPRVRKACR